MPSESDRYDYDLWWFPEFPTFDVMYVGSCGDPRANELLLHSVLDRGFINPIMAAFEKQYGKWKVYAFEGMRRTEVAYKLGIPTMPLILVNFDKTRVWSGERLTHSPEVLKEFYEPGWVTDVIMTKERCEVVIRDSEFS